MILIGLGVVHVNVQESWAQTQEAWATWMHMFRKFQSQVYIARIDIASYQEAISLLSLSDSCLPILLSKSLGTISRPMFKKLKPMSKKLEISPKDLDKPLLN